MAGDRGRAEARQVGGGDLGRRLAEGVDGGQPARAEDQGDVVLGDAGEVGEDVGGLAGALLVVGHGGTLDTVGVPAPSAAARQALTDDMSA